MKYRVSKPVPDARSFTCGVVLPDTFYRVIELTRYNGAALEGFESRGYTVEELDDDDKTLPGLYQEVTGLRVTDDSALGVADRASGLTELSAAPPGYQDPAKQVGIPRAERIKRGMTKVNPAQEAQGRKIAQNSLAAQNALEGTRSRLAKAA
jgi:hypothetical protein